MVSLSIMACTDSFTDRDESLHEVNGSVNQAGSLFKNEPARQNEPARFQFKSCNSEAVSTELQLRPAHLM